MINDNKERTIKNHEGFKKMWCWLSENPTKGAIDYVIENKLKQTDKPANFNFACEESYRRKQNKYETCKCCPVKVWKNHEGCQDEGCMKEGSIYKQWRDNWYYGKNYKEQKKLAKEIANLEWE